MPLSLPTFFGAGFECASHIAGTGRRLDLSAETGHRAHAATDYRAIAGMGLGWVRDGIAWHMVEPARGDFRFEDWRRQLADAAESGLMVFWDLLHFGLPDWLDPWGPDLTGRAVELAGRAAEIHLRETGLAGSFCPVNEISFWALAGGEKGWIMPFGLAAGDLWKERLVEVAIAMGHAIRGASPSSVLITAEPLIVVRAGRDEDADEAARQHSAQYVATDLLLAEAPGLFDAFGWNHYPHNQRWLSGHLIGFGAPGMRPLSDLLGEVAARYPDMQHVLAETGAEGAARPWWLRYVADELASARADGIPIVGACWYPVTDYPGWDDARHCPAGILGPASADGARRVNAGMAEALSEAAGRLSGWASASGVDAQGSFAAARVARQVTAARL